jgi:Spy/CpxP family protein refolding chaperone
MFSKFKFNLVAVLILTFGVFAGAALAQDTTSPPNPDKIEKSDKFQRRGGKFARRGGEGFGGGVHRSVGFLRGIELTDAQKAQVKTILESNKPDQAALDQMKSLREARRNGTELTADQKAQLKAARQAQAAKMKSVHEQILNVLTPEQKAQLDQRRQQMEQRRQQRRDLRKQDKPSVDKTTKPVEG